MRAPIFLFLLLSLAFLLSCEKEEPNISQIPEVPVSTDFLIDTTICIVSGDTIELVNIVFSDSVMISAGCSGAASCQTTITSVLFEFHELCINNEYFMAIGSNGYKIPYAFRSDSIISFMDFWGSPGQVTQLSLNLNSDVAKYRYDDASPGGGYHRYSEFKFR